MVRTAKSGITIQQNAVNVGDATTINFAGAGVVGSLSLGVATETIAGGASSVTNSDGTLTISPTTGAVIASLNLAWSNSWSVIQNFYAGLYAQKSLDVLSSAPTNLQFSGEGGVDSSGFTAGDVMIVRIRSYKTLNGVSYGSTNYATTGAYTFVGTNTSWGGSFDGSDYANITGWAVEYNINGGAYVQYSVIPATAGSQTISIENSGSALLPTSITPSVTVGGYDDGTRAYSVYSAYPAHFSDIYVDNPFAVSVGGTGQTDGTLRSNINGSRISFYAGGLYAGAGRTFDYENGLLYDPNFTSISIDIINRRLRNSTGQLRQDYNFNWFYDAAGNVRASFNNDPTLSSGTATDITLKLIPHSTQTADILQLRDVSDSSNQAYFNKKAAFFARAGTTAALTAGSYLTSGPLMTTPEVGAQEFLTDKFYATITTGVARKEYTLNDTALTSGRVPLVTTNGRLTDSANLTFATATLTVGAASSATGILAIKGTTSGTISMTAAAAAGTWTFTLPTTGGTNNYALTTNGSGTATWSQISLTAGITGTLPIGNGGTGQTSYSPGALVFGSGAISSASGTSTQYLRGGTSGAPVFAQVNFSDLSLGSTVLPVANGGSGTGTAFTLGSVIFAGASGTYSQNNTNFFWDNTNSRLGIGTVSPTAKLHLGAGSATANTAPLKFTSGTNLTTAEAGVHEYNGNHYLTNANVRFSVGGSLFDSYTDVSVGGAETDIYTNTLAANTLGVNGGKIIAEYGVNFVTAGTQLTRLQVYFAGTSIWDSTAVAPSTGTTSARVYVELIRVSATVIRYSISLNTTGASGYVYAKVGELTGLTLSNTNILKLTGISSGVGSGVGDIVGKMAYVRFAPAS